MNRLPLKENMVTHAPVLSVSVTANNCCDIHDTVTLGKYTLEHDTCD